MYKIPLNKSTLEKDDLDAAAEVLYSDRLTQGPLVERFEAEFAEYVGAKYAVMVNSGSSANLLAVVACKQYLGWSPGMRISVPALTWSTTVHPLLQALCIPEWRDCSLESFQTKGCQMAVHLLGNATSPRIALIEDCCESLGVYIDGRHVGTFGLAGTFSFYFSHHITTIEGGMVVTDDKALADLMRSIRSHGWARSYDPAEIKLKFPDTDPAFLMLNTGFNLRSTEINAALGLSQLRKLAHFNHRRREIFEYWGGSDMAIAKNVTAAPFCYPLFRYDPDVRANIDAASVETRPLICGNLTKHPAFSAWSGVELPNATLVHKYGFYLGLSPMLNDEEVEYVKEVLKRECK